MGREGRFWTLGSTTPSGWYGPHSERESRSSYLTMLMLMREFDNVVY